MKANYLVLLVLSIVVITAIGWLIWYNSQPATSSATTVAPTPTGNTGQPTTSTGNKITPNPLPANVIPQNIENSMLNPANATDANANAAATGLNLGNLLNGYAGPVN